MKRHLDYSYSQNEDESAPEFTLAIYDDLQNKVDRARLELARASFQLEDRRERMRLYMVSPALRGESR